MAATGLCPSPCPDGLLSATCFAEYCENGAGKHSPMARQGLFFLPLIFMLPIFLGLTGVPASRLRMYLPFCLQFLWV